MNDQFIEAREFVAKAREALRRGDRPAARRLGEQAALRAPNLEDAWLVLTASDPNPQEALGYARRALRLNPQSARARRAVEWATGRLEQAPAPASLPPNPVGALTSLPKKHAYQTAVALPELNSNKPNWLLPALLAGAGFVLVGLIVFIAVTSPVIASIASRLSAPPAATQEKLWAPADVDKPEVTPIDGNAFAPQPAATATSVPMEAAATATPFPTSAFTPTVAPTATAIPTETPAASQTPTATETPGTMSMQVLADTPTSAYVAPTSSAPKPRVASAGNGVRWIDVNLTHQMVYAYEGETIVNSFLVSTGTWAHPTVTGQFKIYVKIRSGNMSGPGYFLPNVPYIMYFYKGYGLHGTYWHSNFGTPMSHGCINLRTDQAAWLFNWASVGTVVNIHY